ncbi:MAG: NAD-dependent epimerase/dehydratase family protein [bacterium]
MNRILITGGCGFVGVNLSLHLLESGYAVTVLDNFSERDDSILRRACKDNNLPLPEVIEADVRNTSNYFKRIKDCDAIVHLAADTNVRESINNPEKNFSNNSSGTLKALEITRRIEGPGKFVFASSNAVVGETSGAVDEQCIPEPLSPYGANKLHGEALCRTYYECYNIHTTALRFANAYGPYSSHKSSVIPKFLHRAREEKPLRIYGDGEQTRDFIHAHDIASAIQTVLEHNEARGEIYQVASGRETRILDLAKYIQQLAAEEGLDVEITHTDPKKGEIKFNFSSIEKIKSHLGWKPQRSLKESLRRLFPASEPVRT